MYLDLLCRSRPQVTDVSGPVCQEISISEACPSSSALCSSVQWQYSAQLTDGANGTGIESVYVRQGNGTLNTSQQAGAAGENVTAVTFSATCCAQTVELVAVDKVGNVGTCTGQARVQQVTTPEPATPTTAAGTTTSSGWRSLAQSQVLCVGMGVALLWM